MQQQQRPRDRVAQQQQMSGSSDFQQQGGQDGPAKQAGEGSYEATRDYQKRVGDYLEKADVQKDAENARPRSAEEARELEEAEREGRSHAKDGK